ncbi:hypothetical protein ABZ691_33050 [Streptomyces sp. NPDC006854]|uniref:hypothetical protein n=1 Tax=Streptomyces sp. NPDC006854 TaxID=3155115 RepID=UPI0033C31323
MGTTVCWNWLLECDEPGTGRRIASEGEVLTPAHTTEQEMREQLLPNINANFQRRYGPGYRVQDLAPAWSIRQS